MKAAHDVRIELVTLGRWVARCSCGECSREVTAIGMTHGWEAGHRDDTDA